MSETLEDDWDYPHVTGSPVGFFVALHEGRNETMEETYTPPADIVAICERSDEKLTAMFREADPDSPEGLDATDIGTIFLMGMDVSAYVRRHPEEKVLLEREDEVRCLQEFRDSVEEAIELDDIHAIVEAFSRALIQYAAFGDPMETLWGDKLFVPKWVELNESEWTDPGETLMHEMIHYRSALSSTQLYEMQKCCDPVWAHPKYRNRLDPKVEIVSFMEATSQGG